MGKVKVSSGEKPKLRPAITPEGRMNQLILLAEDLAEQQLRDGTASSQVITHFLKYGTEKSRLERVKLEAETKLITAKSEALESQKRVEELYTNALNAMRNYSGQGDPDEY